MGNEIWRRFHGDLIADVVATWPSAYKVVISDARLGIIRELPKVYARLEAAKAAADEGVRRRFSHKCRMDSCDGWLLWSV